MIIGSDPVRSDSRVSSDALLFLLFSVTWPFMYFSARMFIFVQ